MWARRGKGGRESEGEGGEGEFELEVEAEKEKVSSSEKGGEMKRTILMSAMAEILT